MSRLNIDPKAARTYLSDLENQRIPNSLMMAPSITTLPAELRQRIYHYLRPPCWYLLDRCHPKAHYYDGMERMPTYSEPFTIPNWTLAIDVKRDRKRPDHLVAVRAQLALAFTCKQLHSEILSGLYSNYIFSVIRDTENLTKMNRFLHIIGPANRRSLRFIEIQGFSPNGAITINELLPSLVASNSTTHLGGILQVPRGFLASLPAFRSQVQVSAQPEHTGLQPQEISIMRLMEKYRGSFHFNIEIKIHLIAHSLSEKIHYWGYSSITGVMHHGILAKRVFSISGLQK